MSFRPAIRRVITFLLIATIIPAPGLAWRAPVGPPAGPPPDGHAFAARAFLDAVNEMTQAAASGRPQIYLVFAVDVAVPPLGPATILDAETSTWYEEFMGELMTQTAGGPAAVIAQEGRPARQGPVPPPRGCNVPCVPTESILDEIEEEDAHIRSLPSAKALAGVPEDVPFEANPNESVPVERTMRVAMDDALQKAGIETNGSFSFKPGTGTVTYEDSLPDGDILVTGTLVDGRIVLRKEFKPVTTSGDIGEPVRIRSTTQRTPPASQATGTETGQAPGASSTTQTAAAGADALPPGARAIPADVVREWGQELYAEYNTLGQQVGGPRDGQGRLLDLNGEVIAPTTVAGLKLVQSAVVTDLETFTEHLQEVQALPRDHKVALGQDLEEAATALRTAAAAHDKAKATFEAFLPSENLYNNSLTRAMQLEKAGDAAGAAEMRAQAAATPYGQYVEARARYVELLNATPLLGIKHDGTFLYEAFGDPSQFPATAAGQNTVAFGQRYVDLLNRYLTGGIAQTKEQAAELSSYNTIEQLAVFASGAYAYVHDRLITMGTMIGSTVTADMMAELRAAANGSLKSWSDAAWQKIADRSLIVLQIGCMFLPGGPLIALGLAGLQILRAGKDTVVAHIEHEDAIARASAAGFEQVVQTGDNATEAAKNLVWTTGLSAFDVYGAMQYARLMRVLRAEQAAAKAAQQAVPESTAANAAGATPPAGTAPPSRPTTTTDRPPDATGWDPSVTPPKTDAEIQALFKQQMTAEAQRDAADDVLTEIQLAREAGVDEKTIKDLTQNFDPKGGALGNRMMADELMKARLTAQGYDINMPREEYTKLQGMAVRAGANGSGLTPEDIAWLNAHAHPGYFEGLPARGYVTGFAQNPFMGGGSGMPTEGFVAGLDAESAMRLQAAWKAQGGQFTPAAATADETGTVILRPGTAAAATADQTGTVILPPGAAGAAADNTGTVILPPRPQGQAIDPNKTVMLDPNKTALLDPNKTVLLDPNKTVLLDPNKTVILENPNPTVRMDPNATAMMDPNATARLADDVTQQILAARRQGVTAQQMATTVRAAMVRANVTPQQFVSTLRQRLTSAPAPKAVPMATLGGPGAATAAPGLDVSLEALGVSSGTAFTVKAINRSGFPVALRGEGIVVEPVPGGLPPATSTGTTPIATPATTQPVEAFCLERLRPVAAEGMPYRVAPPAVQAQHRGLVNVLHAARRVADAGRLRPDSAFAGYFNFVRQWAIWSRQENFDEKRFTMEFVNQTKKNVEGQGMKWTNDMDNVVRKAAPGRWQDITAILNEANAPKAP